VATPAAATEGAPMERCFTLIDVYEFATSFVLVGHADTRRHLLHVSRATAHGAEPTLLPPVSEDLCAYTEADCEAKLHTLADAAGVPLARVLRASALLGMVRFLEGWHLLFVTRSEMAGVIGGHVRPSRPNKK